MYCHVGSKAEPDLESSQDAATLPSSILSQQQYFHQFFDLLRSDNESIGKKVWDLLMLLPTNKEMLDALSTLAAHPTPNGSLTPQANGNGTEAVHWDEILDASSTFKLLYSLQIVESLLLPDMTYVCHFSYPVFCIISNVYLRYKESPCKSVQNGGKGLSH